MSASLCRKKSVKKPNKCKKIRGCKVASGTKRTYCRKAKNTRKKSGSTKTRRVKRQSEIAILKGYNRKQEREMKNLGVL